MVARADTASFRTTGMNWKLMSSFQARMVVARKSYTPPTAAAMTRVRA
jgi:hypothetical protein